MRQTLLRLLGYAFGIALVVLPGNTSAKGSGNCYLGKNSGIPFFKVKYLGDGHYQLWCSEQLVDEVWYNSNFYWARITSTPPFDTVEERGTTTIYHFTQRLSVDQADVSIMPEQKDSR